MKINKSYIIGFIVDYGPPTLLSFIWAFYVVYQQPEDPFWSVFTKNFVPAFFVLNWLAMRFHRTKKTVDNKVRNKKLFEKLEEMDEKISRIEKQLENKN